MQWRLYLFGPPRLERDGRPIEVHLRKGLALLAYCSVTRRPHSRDALATLLWPDKDQQSARANLRRMLYELGQLLGTSFFDVTAESVALHADGAVWLDVEQFQQCLAQASPAAPERLTHLTEAADLYTADFLAGFTLPDCPEFDDWQFFQREDLRRSLASALEQLTSLYQEQEQWDEAILAARRRLVIDPLEEAAHRQLMQLYAYAGQTGAALRQYEECVRILAQELDAPPEEETTSLITAIRSRRFGAQQQKTGERVEPQVVGLIPAAPGTPPPQRLGAGGGLPAYTTPFVGRRQDLAELLRRLSDPHCRLLTIVGPGGMGKTRLASEAARLIAEPGHSAAAELPQFRNGVYFALLQPVISPDRLIPVIADTLGLQSYEGEPPQAQLLHFLREKELLLVLDNFEHLLDGASVVAQLLAAAPGVKLLVTSREALKLQEEWFHPIAGMRLPPAADLHRTGGGRDEPGDRHDPFAGSDAAQLFVQAARRALVAFDPQGEQAEIARICRLVDGIPLALELAASWLKVLSCAEVAREIERGMDILVSRHQNVAARHRSMRVILDQSWQLLGDGTQGSLRRLSVFRGGFLQRAAVTLGADLLTLAELVDVAWIYREPDGRYQMHELLRQYAADKLAEDPGEQAETQDRHMDYYLRLVAERAPALLGPQQRAALDQIAADIDNVQAAWARATATCNVACIDMALESLYLFFHLRSRLLEGRQLFADASHALVEAVGCKDSAQTATVTRRLLARRSVFHLHLGELDAAHDCLVGARAHNTNQRDLAFVELMTGELMRQYGSRASAEAAFHTSLDAAQTIGDRMLMAEALLGLSDLASSFADFGAGEEFARQALVVCRQIQQPGLTIRVVAALAWAANCLGRYSESEQYYRESLAIAEAIANPFGVNLATNFLGWLAFAEGSARLAEAATLCARALAAWRQLSHRINIAMCLGDCALVACEQGEYAHAERCAQEAVALAGELKLLDLLAYNLSALGAAVCGLGELAAGRRHLLRSLQISYPANMHDKSCLMLYILADSLLQESRLPAALGAQAEQKQLQALELLAFVIDNPATWQLVRDRAQYMQADLLARLPAASAVTAATACARGRSRTLDEIAQTLTFEFEG